MSRFITEYPQFFTATIWKSKKLLKPDKYKDIIVDSLRFLVEDQRIRLNAFVIMINHLHLIWQMQPGINSSNVQRDFLKYTAQHIRHDLLKFHPAVLDHFKAALSDRKYQIWKRRSLSIELRTNIVYQQKLNYIHNNPVKAGLCMLPEQYKYSSALLYQTGVDNWGFLKHYND